MTEITDRSPVSQADGLVLSHLRAWSSRNRCLIVCEFGAPHINWEQLISTNLCTCPNRKLTLTALECATLQHMNAPTRNHLNMVHLL